MSDILQGQGRWLPAGHLFSRWLKKAKIQVSYKEHQRGKELGLELTMQPPLTLQPQPLAALPPAGHSPPYQVQSYPSAQLRGKSGPRAIQASGDFSSEHWPPGNFSLQAPVPSLGSVMLLVIVQPVGLISCSL